MNIFLFAQFIEFNSAFSAIFVRHCVYALFFFNFENRCKDVLLLDIYRQSFFFLALLFRLLYSILVQAARVHQGNDEVVVIVPRAS